MASVRCALMIAAPSRSGPEKAGPMSSSGRRRDYTLRGRILGHTPGDLGSAVYSAGADLQQMRAAIERVSFETFTG